MKARGLRPSAFIVSRCLEPLMKHEVRVFGIAKIFVYKHCFCYLKTLNVENVRQKNSLYLQPIALWMAH